MTSRARWLPQPHATYHFWYPDDRREVLAGDAVEPTLVAAPAGTRVWMQGTSGWVDSRSTTLRGRWRREAPDTGEPTVWVSEHAHAARVAGAWDLTRLVRQSDLVLAADPTGTWVPGEAAHIRGVPATEGDVLRWVDLLDAPDAGDKLAAANLLAAALRLDREHLRHLLTAEVVVCLVGLLTDPDRRLVAAAARALTTPFGESGSLGPGFSSDMLNQVRGTFTEAEWLGQLQRALAGAPDEAAGWVATTIWLVPEAVHNGLTGRLTELVEEGCHPARAGALLAFGTAAGCLPSATSPMGVRLARVLEPLVRACDGPAVLAAGRLWNDNSSAPDWLLGPLLPGAFECTFDEFLRLLDEYLGSPWLDAKASQFAAHDLVDRLLAVNFEHCHTSALSRALRQPEGVRAFLAADGVQKICERAKADEFGRWDMLFFMGKVFHETERNEIPLFRERLGKTLTREFCWALVAMDMLNYDFPLLFYAAVDGLMTCSFVAADELCRYHLQDMKTCVGVIGRNLDASLAESWVTDEFLLAPALFTLANFAGENALRDDVRKVLPHLRALRVHADEDVRKAAEGAFTNCA